MKQLDVDGVAHMLRCSRYNKNSPVQEIYEVSRNVPALGIYQDSTAEVEMPINLDDIPSAVQGETALACIAMTMYGSLGLLHTDEEHRRRGLGSLLTEAAARTHAALGFIPHSHVDLTNVSSIKMYKTLAGWKKTHTAAWMIQDFDNFDDE